ncbi:MAG: arginine N-succinyltransferase [Oceanospirillaceae bacterium]
MLFIRPSKVTDIEALLNIANSVGDGMTSMPSCETSWQRKLQSSAQAFNNATAPEQACYFMVLEDSETGDIAGTTAIYTGLGLQQPFYSYQRSTTAHQSESLNTVKHNETLTLVEHFKGASEVGSLFLLPKYRQPGVGQMLARARYLLMADAQHRFSDRVMAELRGWFNEADESPLWQALGSKFFDMPFQEAVTIAATQGPDFITELMPKHPIYTDLLPQSAKEVLGKPNNSSAPALRMLEKEGFKHKGLIDLFDGGPSVDIKLSEIKTIKDSLKGTFQASSALAAGDQDFYISNGNLADFCLTMAKGRVAENGSLLLANETIDLLALSDSAQVRFVPVMQSKKANSVSSQAA